MDEAKGGLVRGEKGGKAVVDCASCGKRFVRKWDRRSPKPPRFCSWGCYAHRPGPIRLSLTENERRRKPLEGRTCALCGAAFRTNRASHRHCGRKCARRARVEARRAARLAARSTAPPTPTRRQRLFLATLATLTEAAGVPPTQPEMAAALGVSSIGSLHGMARRLAALGWLHPTAGRHRGLRLTPEGEREAFA